jgi:hypothetical protein
MKNGALSVLESLVSEFPGLIDGGSEVNGADLVDALTRAIMENNDLQGYLGTFVKVD